MSADPSLFFERSADAPEASNGERAAVQASLGPAFTVTRERLSPGLRSLLLFGSCLSLETRREGSIPDLLAVVDNVDRALRRFELGPVARLVSPILPPTTISLRAPNSNEVIAKLNLIEPAALGDSIRSLPDLYLAGRLSKRSELIHAKSDEHAREIRDLIQAASGAVATAALLAPPRRSPIEAAVRRCFDLSYLAEIRPETEATLRARFKAFEGFYLDRFTPLLRARAIEMGLDVRSGIITDDRPEHVRRREAAALRGLLRRSRSRSIARWPKQALVYRGWFEYIAGKIRRSRAV